MNQMIPPATSNSHSLAWLFFALLTVASWGVYGAFLHTGQVAMNDPVHGRYKAFLFVGVAYFITAVLAMTIDRLLGGEGKVTALDGPKLHAFTRDQLIEALSGTEMWSLAATLSVGVPAAAGSMADAIIGALENGESADA